jgi:hypothetical protein
LAGSLALGAYGVVAVVVTSPQYFSYLFYVVGVALARLPEIFMVHEHGDVHEIQLRQDLKQGLAQVQDGNFTA